MSKLDTVREALAPIFDLDHVTISEQDKPVCPRCCALDAMQALRDAEAELPRWQPIETAPKDGTWVLVWREHEPGYDRDRIGVDWWVERVSAWWNSRRQMQPTHWMPLPPPPAEDAGRKGDG